MLDCNDRIKFAEKSLCRNYQGTLTKFAFAKSKNVVRAYLQWFLIPCDSEQTDLQIYVFGPASN